MFVCNFSVFKGRGHCEQVSLIHTFDSKGKRLSRVTVVCIQQITFVREGEADTGAGNYMSDIRGKLIHQTLTVLVWHWGYKTVRDLKELPV